MVLVPFPSTVKAVPLAGESKSNEFATAPLVNDNSNGRLAVSLLVPLVAVTVQSRKAVCPWPKPNDSIKPSIDARSKVKTVSDPMLLEGMEASGTEKSPPGRSACQVYETEPDKLLDGSHVTSIVVVAKPSTVKLVPSAGDNKLN